MRQMAGSTSCVWERTERTLKLKMRMEFVDESIVSIYTVRVKSGTERKVAHT